MTHDCADNNDSVIFSCVTVRTFLGFVCLRTVCSCCLSHPFPFSPCPCDHSVCSGTEYFLNLLRQTTKKRRPLGSGSLISKSKLWMQACIGVCVHQLMLDEGVRMLGLVGIPGSAKSFVSGVCVCVRVCVCVVCVVRIRMKRLKNAPNYRRAFSRTHLLTRTHAHAWAFRVMTWLEQEDADILEARKAVLESMEGIDVYCDEVSSSELTRE